MNAGLAANGGDVVILTPAAGEADRVRELFLASYPEGNTRAAYTRDLRDWWTWCAQHGGDPLEANRAAVEGWCRALEQTLVARGKKPPKPMSPATIGRKVSVVRSFYAYAVDQGYLAKSPVPAEGKRLHLPKVPRVSSTQAPDLAEGKAMIAAAKADGPLAHAIVTLALTQGRRAAELAKLDLGDVYTVGEHRVLRTRHAKGGQWHIQVLAPDARIALDTYLAERTEQGFLDGLPALFGEADEEPLFLALRESKTRGRRMDRHAITYIIRRAANHAGVDTKKITPHSMRHACTTALVDRGVPMSRIQEFLGHADVATTARYVQASQNLNESPAYTFAGVWS